MINLKSGLEHRTLGRAREVKLTLNLKPNLLRIYVCHAERAIHEIGLPFRAFYLKEKLQTLNKRCHIICSQTGADFVQ